MKRFFILLLNVLATILIIGCTQNITVPANSDHVSQESIDSLAVQLHKLDSLYNSGNLLHMDIYKLDKLKTIEFSVQSIEVEGEKYQYINLRKDCGNDYYYRWEDARILPDEVQYFYKALETIKSNWHRETDHEERYAYITKDDIRLFAKNDGGGSKWTVYLSVDYKQDNSEVSLTETDIEKLVDLLNKGVAKIQQISK